jgi:hypothetical protein
MYLFTYLLTVVPGLNPLTPNDLKRRRAVSPLKIEIPSKNLGRQRCSELFNSGVKVLTFVVRLFKLSSFEIWHKIRSIRFIIRPHINTKFKKKATGFIIFLLPFYIFIFIKIPIMPFRAETCSVL